ncbi:hypothetical protein DL768_004039 [Monosporascus sp. mg162]|nr:hypothetical protein DL768_004039 [Monosporascus sp. mg162]
MVSILTRARRAHESSGDEFEDAFSEYEDLSVEEYEAVDDERAAAPGAVNGDVRKELYEHAQFELRMSKFELLFERAILGEAQYVRHKDSAYWRMANLLPTRHMHLVSATPTLNHVRDIKGHYLLLIKVSRAEEIFDVDDEPDRLDQVLASGYDAAVRHLSLDNEKHEVASVRRDHAKELADLVDYFNEKLIRPDLEDMFALSEFVDGVSPEDAKTKINYAVLWLLSLSSFDMYLKNVLTKEDGISRLEPEQLQAKVVRVVIGAKNTRPTKRSLEKRKKAELAENLPAFGVDHTEHLIQLDPNGGLNIFEIVKHDPYIIPPPPWASVRPSVPGPLTSPFHKHVASILAKIGFGVNNVTVFVGNMNMSSAGVNFQGACSFGIVAMFHWDLATIVQMFRGLHRFGQLKAVEWRALKVAHPFYNIQENRTCCKFADDLLASGCIPPVYPLPPPVPYDRLRDDHTGQAGSKSDTFRNRKYKHEYTNRNPGSPQRRLGAMASKLAGLVIALLAEVWQDKPNVHKVIVCIEDVIEAIADDKIHRYTLTWEDVYRRVEQQFAAAQYAEYESELEGEDADTDGGDARTKTPRKAKKKDTRRGSARKAARGKKDRFPLSQETVQDDSDDSDDGQYADTTTEPDFAAIARNFTTELLKRRQPSPQPAPEHGSCPTPGRQPFPEKPGEPSEGEDEKGESHTLFHRVWARYQLLFSPRKGAHNSQGAKCSFKAGRTSVPSTPKSGSVPASCTKSNYRKHLRTITAAQWKGYEYTNTDFGNRFSGLSNSTDPEVKEFFLAQLRESTAPGLARAHAKKNKGTKCKEQVRGTKKTSSGFNQWWRYVDVHGGRPRQEALRGTGDAGPDQERRSQRPQATRKLIKPLSSW